MDRKTRIKLLQAAFWGALFLLTAVKLPAEPVGCDMTSEVDRAEVLAREGR